MSEIDHLFEKMRDVEAEVTELRHDVNDLARTRDDIAELRADIKGLVEVWETAGGVVRFVRWAAKLVTAAGVLWLLVKGLWHPTP